MNTFAYCTGLTSLTIPNSVTNIGHWSFYGCTGLTSVTIPDCVASIGNKAFSGCSGLTAIIIGSGVKTIGSQAFSECLELNDIFIYSVTVPSTQTDAFENSYIEYATLHVPKKSINAYQTSEPWKNFKEIIKIDIPSHALTYKIDDEVYKTLDLEEGEDIIPEPAPTKEGYTFSGWSEIPETMPDHDVTVTGSFTINKYNLIYQIDDEVFKSYEIEFGATITPEPAPTKEGYSFSGWSEIPETMPAHDVTVTGSFTANKYKLTYMVDNTEYKIVEVEYGAKITPEPDPTKEGYTFSGWSEIPETMPANDVTITGTFAINKYMLTYVVDGDVYKSYDVEYGATITPEAEPTKDGYTFSGWSDIPETMPAHDVTVTGTFTRGAYKLFYVVDGETYKTISYDYGETITPEPYPTKEGFSFSGWSDIPETMPAHDVTVTGSFTVNSYKLTYMLDDVIYKEVEYDYGATIIPEAQPEGDYDYFEWTGLPTTMPAHDVVVYAKYTIHVDKEKCAIPTISYSNGQLIYACDTEGAECVTKISDTDIKTHYGNEVSLTATYNISVYATKSGYDNSDAATATLCWIDSEPKTEGVTDGIAQIPSKAVLIQSDGGIVKVEGIDDGTPVVIYTTDGKQAGSAVCRNGAALVDTNIQPGTVAIVKIDNQAVKVVIK